MYGSTLDAFTCVQTLMSMGLSADNIFMVQPPAQYEVKFHAQLCFTNLLFHPSSHGIYILFLKPHIKIDFANSEYLVWLEYSFFIGATYIVLEFI